MSSLFRTIFAPLTALGLLLASPAIAQTAAPDPHHPAGAPAAAAPAAPGMMMPMMGGGMMPMMHQMMGGGMMGMMLKHTDGYFAFLKAELGITDAQNAVWTAYKEQLTALIKRHRDAMAMMQGSEAGSRDWIERLTDSEARLSEHLEMMKKIRPAATALYAALSAEQKTKADALMPSMPGAMGMNMGGMHKGK